MINLFKKRFTPELITARAVRKLNSFSEWISSNVAADGVAAGGGAGAGAVADVKLPLQWTPQSQAVVSL